VKLLKFRSKRRLKWLAGWLIVGVSFYIIDCLIVTYLTKLRLDLPWFERGIFAGGPAGILLTVAWLVFPAARRIFKRIDTRPRE
jgi:hypothetical protein